MCLLMSSSFGSACNQTLDAWWGEFSYADCRCSLVSDLAMMAWQLLLKIKLSFHEESVPRPGKAIWKQITECFDSAVSGFALHLE